MPKNKAEQGTINNSEGLRFKDAYRGSMPPDEERLRRPFDFYVHSLDGEKTPVWNQMIRELGVNDVNQIKGVISQEGIVVWSNQVPAHLYLLDATGMYDYDKAGTIQTRYPTGFAAPQLWIYSDQPEVIEKFANYLRRNIDPQIPLSIWTSVIRVNSKTPPVEISKR